MVHSIFQLFKPRRMTRIRFVIELWMLILLLGYILHGLKMGIVVVFSLVYLNI